jgi:hypothetical protein
MAQALYLADKYNLNDNIKINNILIVLNKIFKMFLTVVIDEPPTA